MRTMYDAVTTANIPANARMVAGYIDRIKLAPWTAADWARFPRAVKVEIVKKASTNAGHVLDVEPGDATPAEAPGWVRMRRAAGAIPTVYCNTSTWPSVRAAFRSAGVAEPYYWLARYDGKSDWDAGWAAAGVVAKQYRGNVAPGFDLSSVADHWPGVDGDDIVTPEDIKAIAAACGQATLDAALQNKSNGQMIPFRELAGWTLRGIDVANDKLNGISKVLTDLALKVGQQNGVTAEQLAAALAPALLPDLVAAVKEDLADVEHLDEDAVAAKLAENLAGRLAA